MSPFTLERPVVEERNVFARIAPMKRIEEDLPELKNASNSAAVLANSLGRLSGAIDPNINNGDDALAQLRIGGIRSILNELIQDLESLGV